MRHHVAEKDREEGDVGGDERQDEPDRDVAADQPGQRQGRAGLAGLPVTTATIPPKNHEPRTVEAANETLTIAQGLYGR